MLIVRKSRGGVTISGTIYYSPTEWQDEREMHVVECGNGCILLIETDLAGGDRGFGALPIPSHVSPDAFVPRALTTEEMKAGPSVTISIVFYYTEEYKQAISPTSPEAYIDIIIGKINEGYINSGLNMRVEIHCIQQAMVPEVSDPSKLLKTFSSSK